MKTVWCVELVSDYVLYVRYWDSEWEACRDANRVFQYYHLMPKVFKIQIGV